MRDISAPPTIFTSNKHEAQSETQLPQCRDQWVEHSRAVGISLQQTDRNFGTQALSHQFETTINGHTLNQGKCECLQTTLRLLEEFENRATTTDSSNLDSVLSKQQSALNNCLRMARCVSCAARSDYMILLGVVSDKLITSYEQVVMDKDAKLHAGTDNRDDQEGGKMACSVVSSGPISAAAPDTRRKCAISFGCYQVDGTTEWEFVVKVLIVLQLRQVFILLAHMQSIAEGTSRDQHVSALRMRKQRLQTLTSRVRNSVKL